jgi:hypothetical protein
MYFLQQRKENNECQDSVSSRYTAAGDQRVSAVAMFALCPQFQNGVTLNLAVYYLPERIQINFIRQLSFSIQYQITLKYIQKFRNWPCSRTDTRSFYALSAKKTWESKINIFDLNGNQTRDCSVCGANNGAAMMWHYFMRKEREQTPPVSACAPLTNSKRNVTMTVSGSVGPVNMRHLKG